MILQSKKWRTLVGTLKDKASLSKATFLSTTAATPTTAAAATSSSSSQISPELAVLRATTHHPSADPANPKHIQSLLSFGRGSRLAAASAVAALTSRLRSTHDSTVALKCLIAIHHIINNGSFILQDQLVCALCPTFGGHNHLNLSGFRPNSSIPNSWASSSWVRWYACVLELLISSSRVTGMFLNHNGDVDIEHEEEKVTSLLNGDLLKEIDSLVAIMEEIYKAPDRSSATKNRLVGEVVRLVEDAALAAEHEILIRVREMGQRMDTIEFGDSVELVCLLRRLEDSCMEKVRARASWDSEEEDEPPPPSSDSGDVKKAAKFWAVVLDMKEKVGAVVVEKEEQGTRARLRRRERASESARIEDHRVVTSSNRPVPFASARWDRR